jgi:two-component system LytT family response regulator
MATITQSGDPILERRLVREGPHVYVLPVETVDYVEAQDDYIQIQVSGRSYLKQMTLSELETQLDRKRFLRIHRTYILNIERITKIELYALQMVQM